MTEQTIKKKNKIGAFIGKLSPIHRGHITSIIKASSMVDELYVVCSYNEAYEKKLCVNTLYKQITLTQKLQCLEQELKGVPNIKIIGLDEKNIKEFPEGLEEWFTLFNDSFKSINIDYFFGGEPSYESILQKYFSNSKYITINKERTEINISATKIRKNPYKYWDYIAKSIRHFFTYKVLIIGGESCGKTTMTDILGKYYNTVISTETGRYFSQKFSGRDELLTHKDFETIAYEKIQSDNFAIQNANRITFFDTDIITTQYYCELYTGHKNKIVESIIKNSNLVYNLIIALPPTIDHVMDFQREFSHKLVGGHDKVTRERAMIDLIDYHKFYGQDKIIILEGNTYEERLKNILSIINKKIEELIYEV